MIVVGEMVFQWVSDGCQTFQVWFRGVMHTVSVRAKAGWRRVVFYLSNGAVVVGTALPLGTSFSAEKVQEPAAVSAHDRHHEDHPQEEGRYNPDRIETGGTIPGSGAITTTTTTPASTSPVTFMWDGTGWSGRPY